jgi:hypothetical protein
MQNIFVKMVILDIPLIYYHSMSYFTILHVDLICIQTFKRICSRLQNPDQIHLANMHCFQEKTASIISQISTVWHLNYSFLSTFSHNTKTIQIYILQSAWWSTGKIVFFLSKIKPRWLCQISKESFHVQDSGRHIKYD